jgi:hypothetical protein
MILESVLKNTPLLKKFFFFLFFVLPFCIFSQISKDSIQKKVSLSDRLYLGVKFGVPNAIGVSFEGVTPFLDDRIGVFVDYSNYSTELSKTGIKVATKDIVINGVSLANIPFVGDISKLISDKFINSFDKQVNIEYFEYGLNFYFKKISPRFYASLSQGIFKTDYSFKFKEPLTIISEIVLKDKVKVSDRFTLTNIKIGYKTKQKIFVRGELGISLNSLPTNISFETNMDNISQELIITYPDIFRSIGNRLLALNFGVGYRF